MTLRGAGRAAVALLFLLACLSGCGPDASSRNQPGPTPVTVMTFNIRYGTADDGANRWEQRRALVLDVIRQRDPDILATQEALRFQLDELRANLGGYEELGVGRDDGAAAGEYAAILYRADRFEVVAHGTFWFSETPELPGSIGWGARLPRICSWARLRDRDFGRSLYIYNVHFDHESQESRERSAALLIERIHGQAGGDPVIVAGDFNAGEDNLAMRILRGDDRPAGPSLRDSYRVLYPDEAQVGTFNGFRGDTSGPKIDGVFVSDGWRVEAAAIVRTSPLGRYPSDHFPVVATLSLR